MRINLLGIEFDALTISGLHEEILGAITSRQRKVIANHNLHSLYLFHTDSRMREFFRLADKIHLDSMPLLYFARLFGYKIRPEHRVTYVDWIWLLVAECAQRGWRVFYLGGRSGIAVKAAQRLQAIYPQLAVGTHHGYFEKSGSENLEVLARIRDFKPDILMLGMGMPLQEYWITENLHQITAPVILTAGACFDYVAGALPTPPRWMGRVGLEWLFRLLSEPRRLWKRYLLEPWYILGLVLREIVQPKSWHVKK